MEFPSLGKHCKMEFCNKLDFLPINCDSCKETFCSEHYSYVKHNCQGAQRKDFQVPICPICQQPVPSEKGREDFSVSQHIDKFCKTQTKIYTNSCSYKDSKGNYCKKKELVEIFCSTCKLKFCLKHRHENVHKCEGPINQQRNKIAEAAMRRMNQQQQSSQNSHNDHFSKVQGTMSEDEALAKAIYESMVQQNQQITAGNGSSSSAANDRNKNCAIS